MLVAVLAACGSGGAFQPLPSHGEPQIGVAYPVTFSCPVSFTIGDTWWDFDNSPSIHWPPDGPHGPLDVVMEPHAVPGVLTLTSSNSGVFVADVDHSRLRVSRSPAGGRNPGGCL
jgi:hypothetical protein